MSIKDIMKIPYIMFVIGMLDAPHVDYETKKKDEKVNRPTDADAQIAAIVGALS